MSSGYWRPFYLCLIMLTTASCGWNNCHCRIKCRAIIQINSFYIVAISDTILITRFDKTKKVILKGRYIHVHYAAKLCTRRNPFQHLALARLFDDFCKFCYLLIYFCYATILQTLNATDGRVSVMQLPISPIHYSLFKCSMNSAKTTR